MVAAGQPLASLLASSQKIIIRAAGTESDKADASKLSPPKDVSVERTADDRFAMSTVGNTPGERNAINGNLIDVYFANPPGDTVDPVAPHLQAVIDGAKHTLDAAFFQVNNPDLIDAFIRAQQRGVKIRFVTDTDYFANVTYAPGYQRMVAAGIPVVDDKRSALMHSKFMVVDGAAVWTGSYNLIVPDHHLFDHADNALYLRSRDLATYHTEQFEQLFAGKFGPKKQDAGHHDVFIDGVHVEFYFAPTDHLLDHVTAAVNVAHTSVHFATFSFYQRELAASMLTADSNKIDVAGMFDVSSTGASSEFPVLSQAGIDVRSADPAGPSLFLHDKFFVLDSGTPEATIMTGSPNFSDSAYGSNDEAMYIVHDRSIAAQYEKTFHVFYDGAVGPNKH